jgi:hypothetical protein
MLDMPRPANEPEAAFVVSQILFFFFELNEVPSTTYGDPITVTRGDVAYNLRHAFLRRWLFAELELVKYGYEHFLPFESERDILRIAIAIYDDDFNA